jgi:lincosamide nucleotidyltransferase A/C/D/E
MSTSPLAREMSLQDVLEFLDLADDLGIRVWLIGGWAVDACLGEQTRPHADLDIVIEQRDTPTLVRELRRRGCGDVPRDDTRPENFVLGDSSGREIDFHVVVLDEHGHGIYGPPENGLLLPPEALSGSGVLGGRTIWCPTPSWLVQSHTGYPVDEEDWADVSSLCRRFDLSVPADYSGFVADR